MNGKLYHMLQCESNLSIKKSAVLNISVLYIIALGLSVYKKITSNMTNTFRSKKKTYAGEISQWLNAHLACKRSWVQILVRP